MMKKIITLALVGTTFTFLTILGTGCAKKPKIPEVQEETAREVTTPSPTPAPKVTTSKKPAKKVTKKPYKGFKPVSEKKSRRGMLAGIQFEDIHFDFDKYEIQKDDKSKLQSMAAKLKKNSRLSITIEGHCDERGTNAYNRALGDKRAGSAKKFLYSLGISKSRITTVSYGEEKPACMGHKENCWRKNRRDHFLVTQGRN